MTNTNTNNHVTISSKAIEAMLLLAAKNDIRYYLNGLFIEYNESTTRVIATNGHVLGVYQEARENQGSGSLLVSRESLALLPKKYKGEVILSKMDESKKWNMQAQALSANIIEIEGKFPDYRRVCHSLQTTGTSGEIAAYSLDSLQAFEKVGVILNGRKYKNGGQWHKVYQNGSASALVTIEGLACDFAGVIMPIRAAEGQAGAMMPLGLTSDLAGE